MNANVFGSAAWGLIVLTACGSSPPVAPPNPPSAPAPAPEMVEIWSAAGNVSTINATGIGERAVYVVVRQRSEDGRWEQRLHSIDRASRQDTSRVVGADVALIRIDPLIVESWDGQQARWLGTRIVRLSDALEPLWRSDPMNMSTPEYATGPLILVEQVQRGEYVGLDPDDGAVVFRLRGEPDGIMNYAVEAESFIVIPTEDRAILVDRESGEISGVVNAAFGDWEVVGDRLLVALPGRWIAYDGHGREAWSREGEALLAGRTILSWLPDVPPGRSDVLLVWQRGRGLVAIDEAGRDRWVYPLTDEDRWSHVVQRGDRVFLSERATMLDVRSGEVLFTSAEGSEIVGHDENGVLVRETGPDDSVTLVLYGYDGGRRWRHAMGRLEVDGHPATASAALLPGVVAACPPSGPVTFLDRADGSVLSTRPLPSVPEAESSGSAYCHLDFRGELVLAVTEQGAALFGPSRSDAHTIPAPVRLDPIAAPPDDPAPASRPLYRLATRVPPADGPPEEAYARGRAAYRRAREAFVAEHFQEAASGFIEAYRALFAAQDPDVQQLGLECCYDARLSADRAGGSAYDALLAALTERDEHCRNIVVHAPPPSRPF